MLLVDFLDCYFLEFEFGLVRFEMILGFRFGVEIEFLFGL